MSAVATETAFQPQDTTETEARSEDSLDRYFREIGRHPLLSRAEEARLARLAQDGDENARRRLVESNLRLVVAIARRYRGLGIDLLDLIQEGNLGLIAAVNGYDGREDVRFATYASWAIRRSICRALSSKSRLIRLPIRLAEQASVVRRAEQELAQALGRKPATAEVALASGVEVDAVEELQQARENLVSLSEPVGDEEDVTLADLIRDDELDPAATVTDTDEKASVRGACAALGARSRRILELRYGIDGREPRTLAQVACELGVSAERARVLEAKALRELAGRPELSQLRAAA